MRGLFKFREMWHPGSGWGNFWDGNASRPLLIKKKTREVGVKWLLMNSRRFYIRWLDTMSRRPRGYCFKNTYRTENLHSFYLIIPPHVWKHIKKKAANMEHLEKSSRNLSHAAFIDWSKAVHHVAIHQAHVNGKKWFDNIMIWDYKKNKI